MDKISVLVNIDLSHKIGRINPYLFGGFVEFIRDCVNPGIQAQVLTDRSFETTVEGDQPLKYWYCERFNNTCIISTESRSPEGGYCLVLNTIDHFGGYVAIRQYNRHFLPQVPYTVSSWIYADSQFSGKLYCEISSQNGTIIVPLEHKLGEWSNVVTTIDRIESNDATFSIVVEGTGVVKIDDVSVVPSNAINGVWPEIISRVKELKCGIMRFPGGCFADVYDWRDGIGPNRVFKENLHWGGMEDNTFGTDEFIEFCKNVQCDPMICINFGSGTPELAAAWVEYCNGSPKTPYGSLRAKNGHPEPYNIKFWEIGNENYGDWEVGNCDAETFSSRFVDFYTAMKAVDPTIEIIACGTNEYDASMDWNDKLMSLPNKPDVLALHLYSPQCREQPPKGDDIYYATVGASVKFERIIRTAAEQMRNAGVPPRLAVSEWNAMYITNSCRERTMEAAVFNASLMLSFMRCSEYLEIGNFSDLVNGWEGACIVNNYGEIYSTPSYYAIKLFSNSQSEYALKTDVKCESYSIDKVGHIENITVPFVDCLACETHDGINVFVVNRDSKRNASMKIEGFNLDEYHLYSHQIISGLPYVRNAYMDEQCVIRSVNPVASEIVVEPCSINLFHFKKEEGQ